MRVIALFGRGDIGKTNCLGHLINLIHRETKGCNCLYEGKDARITLDYLGKKVTICTWGDNDYEEGLNIDKIRQDRPDIAVVATRTKGETLKRVEAFCDEIGCKLKKVEKYVASFDDKSGQEQVNKQQAREILDYIRGLIKGQLYYVDSITGIGETEGRYHVELIGANMPVEGYPRTLSLELNSNQLVYFDLERPIREDEFVLYKPDSDNQFMSGNEEPEAKALRNEIRQLRRDLTELEISGEEAFATRQEIPGVVKSYHVNVGHGNCSLILTVYDNDYELWMVDCSTFDNKIRRDYSQNLYHCLEDIAKQLGIDLSELRIKKFMLTHTHADHYNGMLYLISKGYIDADTLIYANLYYDCSSPVWGWVLNGLKKLKCHFVEPVWNNQMNGALHIYHPECRIYKNKSSIIGDTPNRIVSNANDASVVYGMEFDGRIMVLPGDLEQKGFQNMSLSGKCSNDLFKAKYYAVSHHGSINGHPAMPCMNPSQPIPTVLECASKRISHTVLMGRDGAYSGIYSSVVTGYWATQGNGLEYTEKAEHYVEIDWTTDTVRYL